MLKSMELPRFLIYATRIVISRSTFISSTLLTTLIGDNLIFISDSIFYLGPTGSALKFCHLMSTISLVNITTLSLPRHTSSSTLNHLPSLYSCDQNDLKRSCDVSLSFSVWYVAKVKNSIEIHECTFRRPSVAGICISSTGSDGFWTQRLFLVIKNSVISHHTNGGMDLDTGYLIHLSLMLENTVISDNSNTSLLASGLSIATKKSNLKLKTTIYLKNTTFENNIHNIGRKKAATLFLSRLSNITIDNCQFINNLGSAIRAIDLEGVGIKFTGHNEFIFNIAHRGGALYLFNSTMTLAPYTSIILQNNSANDVGGAIYTDHNICGRDTTEWCFFQLLNSVGSCQDRFLSNLPNLFFANNSALNGGECVFGPSLSSNCKVNERFHYSTMECTLLYENSSLSAISSAPTRVCLCGELVLQQGITNNCLNTSLIFVSKFVHSGEEFYLKAVLVGDMFGTGTGSVYAQFLNNGLSSNRPVLGTSYQYSQRVGDYMKCQRLNYTVYSVNHHEVLVLTANDETVSAITDKKEVDDEIRSFRYDYEGITPSSSLLTLPVYINLTLLPCPPGFHLAGTPPGCDCVPAISLNSMQCNFENGAGYIYRNGTLWTKVFNESIMLQKHCPFDYCQVEIVGVNINDTDRQCAMKHAGILCGACKPGFSLALGSNKCLLCSDSNNLALLIFFAAAGFLLVFFIKILNMTVSHGTINGLIFYANIVWAYESIFFPSDSVSLGRVWFLKIFIAWTNLDFGIETCFVQGLTGYTKTWLQFVFPVYVWGIAGVMIASAHYSSLVTRLLGNNSVQVLATLILVSYSKLLRSIIIALVPAVINEYRYDATWFKHHINWAFDGNYSYCGVPHVFLFVVACLALLILWIPYTFILLSFQLLRRGTSFKCLQCIIKIVPFFETYFGPLKIGHWYWIGVLLLVRGILLVIFTLTYTNTPSAGLLAIIIVITFLLVLLASTGHVYKHRLLSMLECSFLVNLQLLAASFLFADLMEGNSKKLIVCISIGVAFSQFIGIVIYHTWLHVSKMLSTRCRCWYLKWQEGRAAGDNELHAYQLMNDRLKSEKDIILKDICKELFLEDHAVDADALLTDTVHTK